MTDAIGRGDYVLGADTTGVKEGVAEAEQTIGASGAKAGKAFSSGLSIGLKAVGTVAAGAFAIATKGLLELDSVTADYKRETGETGAAAAKAGDAINKMSGKNIQPMREIGSALAAVHTQMGLTGDAAEVMTQRFLRFGRATGQEATSAVKSFDDILDAWGLTAKDAGRIMDNLVASHQKYGGSIEANQAALAAMAPQLKALNLAWEDGVGLLNLFASSGLDASQAQRALNAAISNLPPGTSLKDFIAHLATIPDDGKRAQEAMTVFGTRAGAGLANAIKPGVASLDAFKLSTQEYTGATERAAAAADDTFGTKVQLAIKAFGSALNTAFKDAGPLLTGLGALSSVGATFGVDTLLKKLAPRVIAGMRSIGAKAGDALGDGMSAIWSGAGGTVVGNNIASRIENIMDPTKSTVIGNAWRGAASKATTLYLATLLAGDAAVGAVGARLGTTAGTAFGKAMSLAAVLGVGLLAAAVAEEIQKMNLGKQVHDAIFGAAKGPGVVNLNALDDWQWPIGNKGAPDWARSAEMAENGAAAVGSAVIDGITSSVTDVGGKITTEIADGLEAGRYKIQNGALVMAAPIPEEVGKAGKDAETKVKLTMGAIADEIRTGRQGVVDAMQQVINDTYDPLINAAEISAIKAELGSKDLAKALRSSDPEIRRDAELRRLNLQKQLAQHVADQTKYGSDAARIAKLKAELTSTELVNGLKSKDPARRKAAQAMRDSIQSELAALERSAHGYGFRTGEAYAHGLTAATKDITDAASNALAGARGKFRATSPPGPESPLHNIDKWGERTMQAYADGIRRGGSAITRAASAALSGVGPFGVPTAALSGAGGGVLGVGAGGSSPVTNHYVTNQNVSVQGLLRAETPDDVALQLRRAASLGF